MLDIPANELKIKGVAAIEAVLAHELEAVISIRGKRRFVVMAVEQYNHLRECELEAALIETRQEMAAGRFVTGSPEEHLARLEAGE